MNATLANALADIVGLDQVLTDPAACDLASSDLFIWPHRQRAELVVRPKDVQQLSAVMRLLHEADMPAVPRGAGMSYTGGVVPGMPAVVLELTRLDSIDIHADDLYAVVGAGCTWEALAAALQPHHLRAVQPNPISGSVSTVGGAASQNVPGGMHGIVGLTVVLSDGTIAHTGSGAMVQGAHGQCNAGPDLTGLFLGDCGAFGVKAAIALRLAPAHPAAFASFAYDDADALLIDMMRLLRDGLVTRAFSMDQAKTQTATDVGVGEAAGIVGAVVRNAGSITQAVRDVAQLAMSKRSLNSATWSLHCVVEAPTQALADEELLLAKRVCAQGAKEIDNVLPKTLHAKPYSIRGFVGPLGERWVPIHGIIPLSRARACMAELQGHFALHEQELSKLGITHTWMISSMGAYLTIEPMLYWNDALDPLHLRNLSERNRTRFDHFAPNPVARDRVRSMRNELCEIMDQHGAIHAQIGRFYPYAGRMDAGSHELLQRIKQALDPKAVMNPGALLPATRKRI